MRSVGGRTCELFRYIAVEDPPEMMTSRLPYASCGYQRCCPRLPHKLQARQQSRRYHTWPHPASCQTVFLLQKFSTFFRMLDKQTGKDWITVALILLPLIVLTCLTFFAVYFANSIGKRFGWTRFNRRACFCFSRKAEKNPIKPFENVEKSDKNQGQLEV